MHKNDSQPTSIDPPCFVRQKLCRTTSAYDSTCKTHVLRGIRKRNKGRTILSAGGRPRNGPGMLSISLPEHTLRAALDNVARAQRGGHNEDEETDSDDEGCSSDITKQKGSKNDHSSGQNVMKLDEMFEKAKLLLPLRCECVNEDVTEESEASTEKKEWTIFSFCYECGRTSGVHLVKCPGCRGVSYCSRTCRTDSWKKGHQIECTGAQVKLKDTSPGKGRGGPHQRSKTTKRANSSN